MTVLFLGPESSGSLEHLRQQDEPVVDTIEPIDEAMLELIQPDILVSHGFRHIVPPWILDRFPGLPLTFTSRFFRGIGVLTQTSGVSSKGLPAA